MKYKEQVERNVINIQTMNKNINKGLKNRSIAPEKIVELTDRIDQLIDHIFDLLESESRDF